jgi:hypothetical protein
LVSENLDLVIVCYVLWLSSALSKDEKTDKLTVGNKQKANWPNALGKGASKVSAFCGALMVSVETAHSSIYGKYVKLLWCCVGLPKV